MIKQIHPHDPYLSLCSKILYLNLFQIDSEIFKSNRKLNHASSSHIFMVQTEYLKVQIAILYLNPEFDWYLPSLV